jgi:predicted ATP-grasp superfamily ATP-dependent carboligase
MPPTVLLTIGRMPKALDLARGFRAAGCRVIAADPFPWHVCRLSRDVARSVRVRAPATDPEGYLDDLAAICREESVDLVVPVSEEAVHAVGLAGRLPAGTRLFAPDAATVRALHDKRAFAARARALGLAVPETAELGTADAARVVADGDVVLKPRWSCGGSGIRFVDAGAALPPADTEPTLVQRRIDGAHVSTCTLAINGTVAVTVAYRATVLSGTVAVAFERVDDAPAVRAWVERFVRDTGYHGFVSFDFIVDDAGTPWAIECNPRVTSGIHLLEPRPVADAILAEDASRPITPRAAAHAQHFWTVLGEAEVALFTGRPSRAKWRAVFRARDVVWAWARPAALLGHDARLVADHQARALRRRAHARRGHAGHHLDGGAPARL